MPVKKASCRFCSALASIHNQEQIVEYRESVLHIGGHIPTDLQVKELLQEVILLQQTTLWKLLTETVKAQALDLAVHTAKDFDQVMFAKAMLHVIQTQESV